MVDEERYNALLARSTTDRDNADLFAELGLMAVEMGRREESVQFLKRALKLNPALKHLEAPLRTVAKPDELKDLVEFVSAAPFRERMVGILHFPFKGHGPYILIAGAIVLGILRTVSFGFVPFPVPLSHHLRLILGMVFWVVLDGYLWGYFFDVIRATTKGRDDPPPWAEILDMFDMLREAVRAAGAAFMAGLPLLGAAGLALASPAAAAALALPAYVYTAIALPMCLLANAMYGNPAAAMDVAMVWRSIRATWSDYALMLPISAALVLTVAPAVVGVVALAGGAPPTFTVMAMMMGATIVEVYAGMVLARMLGLFFHSNQAKLKWFEAIRF